MPERDAAFVGSIPEHYDRHLGPLLFHPNADDLASRVPWAPGARVLEVACGTGILTERLLRGLPRDGRLVATDLNQAMIDRARSRLPSSPSLEWRQADGTDLPFPDGSFDVVACQFGIMFFPDKPAGVAEALRVLAANGTYVLSVWGKLEENPAPRIAHETITRFFPDDPPQFYLVPFSLHDTATVRALLDRAGFRDVVSSRVETIGTSPSANDAAVGLVEGNPVIASIMERRPDALGDIKAAVAERIAAELGERPVRAPLVAHTYVARRA